jgi:ADP-heptose:LPS heptosyltransferase
VLTSPVIRLLRNRYPSADIRFVTKQQFVELVQPNPQLNGVFPLRDSLNELAAELKEFNPDLVVDLHHNLRTRIMKMLIGGKWLAFQKLNVEKWLKVNLKMDRLPDKHIVERYVETLRPLGIENDNAGLEFFFPKDFQQPQIPKALSEGFVAVVVGAKFKTKQLPERKLKELCNGMQQPILLIGGKEDAELGSSIAAQVPNAVNGCGAYTLQESAWLIQQAAVVVTHDTGMMHIAAAFNKKIVSIWGNTVPAFGMYPYLPQGDAAYISEVAGLSCRPCSKIGYDKCPKGHFKCMEEQNIQQVVDKAKEFLEA